MTVHATLGQEKRKSRDSSLRMLFLGFSASFLFLLVLKNAQLANEYMLQGLRLCSHVIVPSLFPFLILSELIVASSVAEKGLRYLSRPLRCLFGLSPSGCCAVFLGILCGFPVGARCIASAYDDGKLSREEAERALCFSNNPSPAFLVSAVGVSLWHNKAFGWLLYIGAVTVNLMTGIILFQRQKKRGTVDAMPDLAPIHGREMHTSGVTVFTRSVKNATGSMLLICGYVVFFTVLGGTLCTVADSLFYFSSVWRALLQSVLELSGGVSQCAMINDRRIAVMLTSFAIGWSGLSVHCQVLSMCEGRGFSHRTYFLIKLLQGVMGALLCLLLSSLFPGLVKG